MNLHVLYSHHRRPAGHTQTQITQLTATIDSIGAATDTMDAFLTGGVDRGVAAPASPPPKPPPPPKQPPLRLHPPTTQRKHRNSAWGNGGKYTKDAARVTTLLDVRTAGRE